MNEPASAPASRVRPGLVVAVAVAVVMLIGIFGLVAVALVGDDGAPSGAGLDRRVDVAAPDTAVVAPAGASDAGGSPSSSPGSPESAAPSGDTNTAAVTTPDGGTSDVDAGNAGTTADGDIGDAPASSDGPTPVTTVQAVDELEAPTGSAELPTPAHGPVELPVLVTNPSPPSTYAAVALADLDPADVAELAAWSVSSRRGKHMALDSDGQALDIWTIDEATTGAALDWFADEIADELTDIDTSPVVLLGSPSDRFVGVAGTQFLGRDAGQQGTQVVSGSVLVGVRADGGAVVMAVSRPGRSSDDELAADGELLRAVLAHL